MTVTYKVDGNIAGDLYADNAVVYGTVNGDVKAYGEKSVVVVFGNVNGEIEADMVINAHDLAKNSK